MTSQKTKRSIKFYQSIPKVELHRHLEGSVRLSTLIDIGRSNGIIDMGTDHLRSLVQVMEGEAYTFKNLLSKFVTLRRFFHSPDVINRITYEAIEDAAADNIKYLELRFTPVALSKGETYPLGEVMDWVIKAAKDAERDNGVITRLIASVNRHESLELAEGVIQLAVDRKDKGLVGLDLAGNEADFPARPFLGAFIEAQKAGMHITIHAGEWSGAFNVREAIDAFGAKRIGHGVRVMEEPEVVDIAREHKTTFEVCITSNYQSGVVPVLKEHQYPKMLLEGLNTTLNTDNPSISQITLSREYWLACEELGVPISRIIQGNLDSAKATFLPDSQRKTLVETLNVDYEKYIP
jgi:adenosine deaminase